MSIYIMSRVWKYSDLSGNKLLCMLALADWANDDGQTWPSYSTLAKKMRVSTRSAKRIVAELEKDGYIIKEKNAGKHQQNVYTIPSDILSPPTTASDASVTTTGDASVTPLVTPVSPYTIETRQKDTSEAFEMFWNAVPKKVGKGAARKAYAAALKKTTSETLIAKIKTYAASRKGKDDQFTAHPATWLNQERWLDGGKVETNTKEVLKFWESRINEKPGQWPAYMRPTPATADDLVAEGYVTEKRMAEVMDW